MTSNGLIIGFHDFLVQVSSPPATLSTSKAVWKALKWLEMASKMVKNAFFKAPKSLPWIYPKPYVCRLFFIWCWTEKMLNRPQKLLFFIQTSSWIKVESSGTFFFLLCSLHLTSLFGVLDVLTYDAYGLLADCEFSPQEHHKKGQKPHPTQKQH